MRARVRVRVRRGLNLFLFLQDQQKKTKKKKKEKIFFPTIMYIYRYFIHSLIQLGNLTFISAHSLHSRTLFFGFWWGGGEGRRERGAFQPQRS